jgi:hypothetical protein
MSDVAHYTTKKAAPTNNDGKGRKKQAMQPQRAETRPAPHGQRIEPIIDPAFVKKVGEELVKRSRVSRVFVQRIVSMLVYLQEEKTIVDKRTIIEYLVKEGVTSEEISEMLSVRCKEKKKMGATTGEHCQRRSDWSMGNDLFREKDN